MPLADDRDPRVNTDLAFRASSPQTALSTSRTVLAIFGSGGMGLACARRLAGGRHVLIGDFSQKNLNFAARASQFAQAAATAGRLETVVHTAGLSPALAPANRILDVDLVGTAIIIIDAFEPLMPAGSSLTCIASIARFGATPSAALARHLASAPRRGAPRAAARQPGAAKGGGYAGGGAAARAWGARGARINSISPGAILTAMLRQELESPSGATITAMIAGSPMGRGRRRMRLPARLRFWRAWTRAS
ncbi:hypothetical protein B0T18DRAFT_442706 [Schizothecium vesticola]|uniref:SDR family oxidoreductase n=1 Tax=Schizothecium vesticola TaxID=314040 RepID=A0AA40FAT9_9PEZI|nr:hypothetical protein B0T18DRAFT_442706 [Schizothecium vesticola]